MILLSHGVDSSSLISISASSVSSRLIDDSSLLWERNLVALNLTGLSIPANGTYVIAWSSSDQGSGSSDEIALDNIQILANPTNASVEASGTVESITLLGDLDLNGQTDLIGNLNLLSGTLTTNDNLTLKSSDGKTAVVGPVVSGAVSGDVTVEQFFPAQRAFRFLGSTVETPFTSAGTIYENWQQGGLNPGDPGYIPGYGTHITGGSIQDGFDQSGTNAPSFFIFANTNRFFLPAQQWTGATSAIGFPMNDSYPTPGSPVRLFIRGDRSVSLTAAGPQAPTATTLTTTGELHIGEYDVDFNVGLSQVEGDFNFVANPYQAQVNFTTLYNDTETNDISGAYYAWDPTIGDRGAYVTYTISTGTNNVEGSEVNEFIQPGQAFFTATAEDDDDTSTLSPVIKFKESFKSTSSNTTAVFRNSNEFISMSVFRDDELSTGKARDGIIISFDANGSNQINAQDIIKFVNPDENLSVETLGTSLSVTQREVPVPAEQIDLKLNGLTGVDYTFHINNALNSMQTILVDHYLGAETILSAGVNNLSVSFDTNIPASLDENRFSLKFENNVLTLDDSAFAKAVQVYPNPFNGSELTIDGLIIGEVVQINVYNMLGQEVVAFENVVSTGKETLINLNNLKNGVYLVQVTQGSLSATNKIVRQ
ncbi:T9SS type A sorting domain-containing protein [Nonlabens sp.]|uniref:T9SS type A sorting domain-containing protein n=1 Tax=Nonlabens sp. TaxID=1888209 RepID=UPI003F6A3AD2